MRALLRDEPCNEMPLLERIASKAMTPKAVSTAPTMTLTTLLDDMCVALACEGDNEYAG